MICTEDGRVLAHAFPATYDPQGLREASRVLVDGFRALGVAAGAESLIDLRFRDVRLVARPCSGALLAVLCGRATNVQLLVLGMTAAATRLDRVFQPPDPPAAATPPRKAIAQPARPPRSAPPPEASEGREEGVAGVAAPAKGLAELRRRLARAGPPPKKT